MELPPARDATSLDQRFRSWSTQLFNYYFEEEKNDGAKDHHEHRGARAGAKMCRVGLATL
jgi:hypothetical protein